MNTPTNTHTEHDKWVGSAGVWQWVVLFLHCVYRVYCVRLLLGIVFTLVLVLLLSMTAC